MYIIRNIQVLFVYTLGIGINSSLKNGIYDAPLKLKLITKTQELNTDNIKP